MINVEVMTRGSPRKAPTQNNCSGVKKRRGISQTKPWQKGIAPSDEGELKPQPSRKLKHDVVKPIESSAGTRDTSKSNSRPAKKVHVKEEIKSEDAEFLYSIAEERTMPGSIEGHRAQRQRVNRGSRVSAREIEWLLKETEQYRMRCFRENMKAAERRECESGYWAALARDVAEKFGLPY